MYKILSEFDIQIDHSKKKKKHQKVNHGVNNQEKKRSFNQEPAWQQWKWKETKRLTGTWIMSE